MNALEELARWIEQVVERHGLVKTLLGPFSTLGIASVFGVRLTSEGARVVLVAIIVCCTMTVVAALTLRLRLLRAEVATKSITLTRYSELLERLASLDYEILCWDEEFAIGKNGDTIIERRVNIRPISQELLFCSTSAASYGRELGQSERGKVLHEVRWMSSDGELSSRLATTYRWEGNKKIVFAHFDEALNPGNDVWLYFKWIWPRYSPLVRDGSPERFDWNFRRHCRSLKATIHILPSANLTGDPRAAALNGMPTPEVSVGRDGSSHVNFAVEAPPLNRPFGFALDGN